MPGGSDDSRAVVDGAESKDGAQNKNFAKNDDVQGKDGESAVEGLAIQ